MGDKIGETKNCKLLATSALRQACEAKNAQKSQPQPDTANPQNSKPIDQKSAYAKCDDRSAHGTDQNNTCRMILNNICLKKSFGPYTVSTNHGPFTAQGPDAQLKCLNLATTLPNLGFSIVEDTETKTPKESETPAPKQAVSSAPIPAPAQNENKGLSKVCSEKDEGPYVIQTNHGPFTAADKETCFKRAGTLTQLGFTPPETSESSPPSPTPVKPNPAPAAASNASAEESGNRSRFVKSFADLKLKLIIPEERPEDPITTKCIILFKDGFGIPITMRYIAEKLQEDNYRITYIIYKNGKALSEEQTLDFKVNNKKFRLGFEVNLENPANFGSVSSIKIVQI